MGTGTSTTATEVCVRFGLSTSGTKWSGFNYSTIFHLRRAKVVTIAASRNGAVGFPKGKPIFLCTKREKFRMQLFVLAMLLL